MELRISRLAPEDNFTALFERARIGDRVAANLVYGMAMPRLRRLADSLLRRYRWHQTLQPTALVAELFVKIRGFNVRIADRNHFFHISARAMHQVLADRARSRASQVTRNSTVLDEFLSELRVATPEFVPVIQDLLGRLERIDRSAAEIVRLHYVEGCNWDEVGERTGKPKWRVRDDAKFALKWMRDHLS